MLRSMISCLLKRCFLLKKTSLDRVNDIAQSLINAGNKI